jgi:hypothetical protein
MKGKENEKHTPAQSALQNQNRRLHLLNEAATKLLTAEDPERAMAGIYERIAGYFQRRTHPEVLRGVGRASRGVPHHPFENG